MDTLLLSYTDTKRLIDVVGVDVIMRDCIARLKDGLTDVACERRPKCPPRGGFLTGGRPGEGVIENMPYMDDQDGMTLKTISYKPRNNALNRLPTVVGVICRYSVDTGELVTICDATIPTAIRTGAATAVASSLLARPDSQTAAIIGAGLQSVTQLHGLSTKFDLDVIRVYDVDRARAQSFRERCTFTSAHVQVVDTPQAAVEGADILVTATSVQPGAGPVLRDENLAAHLHINSIGSDEPGKTELPRSILEKAFICVDHIEQALNEGECQVLERDQIDTTLERLIVDAMSVDGPLPQTRELTVFDSTGVAFEDHLALNVFLNYAAETGIGEKISILDGPIGLHSPYSRSA
jgi:ornithine cyclodeaminase/alanine dehydrogenase-like protein (mu-crystallin family)